MPEAQNFQNWIYTEVLPSIRQKGEYKLKNEIESLTSQLETVRLETEQYKNRLRTIEQTKHQIIEYNEIIYVLTTDEYKSKNFSRS